MRLPLSLPFLLVVALGATGCPSDDETPGVYKTDEFDAGSDPERNAVGPGELCDRLATLQCAAQAFCCDDPQRTIDQCEKRMREGCEDELYLDDIAAEMSSGFDADAARQAFDTLEQLASTCDPGIAAEGFALSGLRGIIRGSVPAGRSCSPPNYPLLLPSDKTAAIALASCAEPDANACMPGETAWRCQPLAAEGEECFTDLNCQAGLYCDNAKLSLSAKCKLRKAAAEACEVQTECESLACRDGTCAATDDVQAAYCLD
jgi:hypothetical protein